MKNAQLDKNRSDPLYAQLAGILLKSLKKTPVGARFCTEREVARQYKIGRMVARAALHRLAQEGYLRRVVSNGTFVADHAPTRRPSKRPLSIAVFCPFGTNMPHAAAVKAISSRMQELGQRVEIRDNEHRQDSTIRHAAEIIQRAMHQYDGIIWVSANTELIHDVPSVIHRLASRLIFINPYLSDHSISCVLRDNRLAIYDLTSHLLGHGYKTVGFVTGSVHKLFSKERLEGYLEAMHANGAKVEPAWVWTDLAYLNYRDGYGLGERLIGEGKPLPRAIVCATDLLALGLMARLKEHGVRVPQDLAVTGFDDDAQALQCSPAITTANQAYGEMGVMASHMLIEQITGTIRPGMKVYVPCPILIRKSCGCGNEREEHNGKITNRRLQTR